MNEGNDAGTGTVSAFCLAHQRKPYVGSEETLRWEHDRNAVRVAEGLCGGGLGIAAVETGPDVMAHFGVDLYDWGRRFPVCVTFGNEA